MNKDRKEIMMELPGFLDKSMFEGRLEEIIENIKNIPDRLVKNYPHNPDIKNYHRFSIRQDTEYEYYSSDSHDVYHLQCWRWETDEEVRIRLEKSKKQSEASKKAAITKKLAQEKREKTLLQTLKKKYEED